MAKAIKSERRERKRLQMLRKQHKGATLAGVHHKLVTTRGLKGTARKLAQITLRRIKA